MRLQSAFPAAWRAPLVALSSVLALSIASAGCTQTAAAADPLIFPQDDYTEETLQASTPQGDKDVVYRLYEHLTYVADPVDPRYQSLDVKVPVSIDGVAVDASDAPILFDIDIGGYTSSANIADPDKTNDMPPPPQGPDGAGPPPGGLYPGAADISGKALAAGFVVVSPGARGRDNRDAQGRYYGKAPAAIVDLKAAVRYLRHNADVLPGDEDRIVSRGCSAGGGLSALLAASGNSPLYAPYLTALGAADARDDVFAAGVASPVTDLDNADPAYEWTYGNARRRADLDLDRDLSDTLRAQYAPYLAALDLEGMGGFGPVTADTLGDYIAGTFLEPQATAALQALSEKARKAYLAENPWITWDGSSARIDFAEFTAQHVTRGKGVPAFSNPDLSTPETGLFGDADTDARVFTDFSLGLATGASDARIDPDLRAIVEMMNPMTFLTGETSDIAGHWFVRTGAVETGLFTFATLSTTLANAGKDVDAAVFWEAGHCEDLDPDGFIAWMGKVTNHTAQQ